MSAMEPLVIGIDVGTGGVRALAISPQGDVVAQAVVEHELLLPRPGWTEQRPEDWWAGSVAALRKVTEHLGERARNIVAVGLTGQMHGSVFLDASGEVIRPALLWNDQRTTAECNEITERVGLDRLLQIAGNPAMTGFTAPKILWLRNHEPDNFARVAKVILPKDYVRYRLTGALATDLADASGTLLVHVAERRWATEILDALDLDPGILPDLFEGTEITGRVHKEAALATGLPEGIPVVAGGGDQAAGAVGLGLIDEGRVSCSVGTSGVVFAASNQPVVHPAGKLHAFCHCVPGRWHVMGVMLSAGGALRWFRDQLATGMNYDAITAEAAEVQPGADGLLFLPYLTGERTPHADPHARGAFIGLGIHQGRKHMARAVLEGITLGLADSVALIRELGIPVPELRITGGGARSDFWSAMMATVFEAPVIRMAVDEGPAFGAGILAAVGAGLYADTQTACENMVKTADTIQPDSTLAETYRGLHQLYQRAYMQLRDLFPELGKVS